MSGKSTLAPETSALQAATKAVEGRVRPAWVVDAVGGRIVAANAAGCQRLALLPASPVLEIDRASPAYRTLRKAASRLLIVSALRDEVAFWTSHGTERMICMIERLRGGDGTLLIVEAVPGNERRPSIVPDHIADRPKKPAPRWPVEDPETVQPALRVEDPQEAATAGPAGLRVTREGSARDDMATLQEIARRIREGQKTLLAMPPILVADDEPVAAAGGARNEAASPVATEADAAAAAAPEGVSASLPAETVSAVAPAVEPKVAPMGAAAPNDAGSLFGAEPGPAARAAHELKTPIGAIAAAAEIMRDERLGRMDSADGRERYLGYAGDIAGNAHHALAVIDRMLGRTTLAAAGSTAAGRVKAGDDVGPVTIDPAAICAAAVATSEAMARRARVDLVCDIGPDLPRLEADATSFKQILLNLLTNAIKFTPQGGGVLLAAVATRGGGLRIDVRDTGEGMTRAAIARALDPSLGGRGHPIGEPRPGGGLGIGLPLVRTLVEAAGGRMSMESVLGSGTTVTLAFDPAVAAKR